METRPFYVMLSRVVGSFSVVAVLVGAVAGYGWPWNPAPDSMIGEEWPGLLLIWVAWAAVEVFYAFSKKRQAAGQ